MNREIKFRFWDINRKLFIFHEEINKEHAYYYINDPEKYFIVPMQYTGFKDKNENEIYEGDILNFGNNNNVEVVFENGSFCVFGEPLGWDFDTDKAPVFTDFKYCKKIGNKYENEDLLKK